MGADLREFRAAFRVARREASRRPAVDLQRSRHVVLLRPLLGVRAGRGPRMAGCRRRRRCARFASDQGTPATRLAHRALADGRRVRHVVLSGPGAGPWLLLTALSALPTRSAMASEDRSAPDGRAAGPDPNRPPLLQARTGAEARDRKLSRR